MLPTRDIMIEKVRLNPSSWKPTLPRGCHGYVSILVNDFDVNAMKTISSRVSNRDNVDTIAVYFLSFLTSDSRAARKGKNVAARRRYDIYKSLLHFVHLVNVDFSSLPECLNYYCKTYCCFGCSYANHKNCNGLGLRESKRAVSCEGSYVEVCCVYHYLYSKKYPDCISLCYYSIYSNCQEYD